MFKETYMNKLISKNHILSPQVFFLFVALFFFKQLSFAQAPVINSYSPVSGTIGSTVTITGNNFSPVLSNNIVYFGDVKAIVSTASSTSLTIVVPKSAAFKPISVTNTTNGLTGYSSRAFIVTFPGGDNSLNTNSFSDKIPFPSSPYADNQPVATGDIDGDGKPEIISLADPGGSAYTLSIFRNTSSANYISFASRIDLTFNGMLGNSLFVSDIDGDGKLDLATTCYQKISVYRNLSSPGSITFSSPVIYTNGVGFTGSIQINDLDKDGKPDIALINDGVVTIRKNNSTVGNISLLDNQVFSVRDNNSAGSNEKIKIADIDGDDKPEIVVTKLTDDSVLVLRNKSSVGLINFDPPIAYFTGAYSDPSNLSVGDLDGDNKPEIIFTAVPINSTNSIRAFKNSSTPGLISLSSQFIAGNAKMGSPVVAGDLNGDGRLDIISEGIYDDLLLLKNNSTPCQFRFDETRGWDSYVAHDIAVSDLNGDGKPDLVLPGLRVYKNNIGQTITLCSGNNTTISSLLSGTVYQWQQNSGNGYINISSNSNFSGTNTSLLQINNIPSSWNGYKYRCLVNSDTSNVYLLSVNSSLIPAITITYCPSLLCAGNNITFIATTNNGGTNPMFQWQDSINSSGWANIANANSATLIYTQNTNGNKVRCQITSSYSCALPAIVNSNTVTLQINSVVTATNVISGNTTVNQNQSTTLTALTTNGGFAPSYIWQDSTNAVSWKNIPGATSSILIYSPAQTGNKVRCIMTSSANCASPAIVTSNSLTFTVNAITAINPVPATNFGIKYYPNPVNNEFTIDNLKLIDKWQTIELFSITGNKIITSKNISGQSKVLLNVESFPNGQYIAVLKSKSEKSAYLKFIKL